MCKIYIILLPQRNNVNNDGNDEVAVLTFNIIRNQFIVAATRNDALARNSDSDRGCDVI